MKTRRLVVRKYVDNFMFCGHESNVDFRYRTTLLKKLQFITTCKHEHSLDTPFVVKQKLKVSWESGVQNEALRNICHICHI